MRGEPLVDVDRAQITTDPDGTTTVDDPESPLLLTVRVVMEHGRPHLMGVRVDARHPHARICTAALARLPLDQVVYLAAQRLRPQHPNETHYRALARPKPHGQRSWDDGHYERVLTVYEWAHATGRAGGGVQAVADMWGVTRSPTAVRWLAEARRRAAAAAAVRDSSTGTAGAAPVAAGGAG